MGMDPGFHRGDDKAWIPAFARRTEWTVDFQSTLFLVAFDVKCNPNTTFTDLVQKVAETKASREVLTLGA